MTLYGSVTMATLPYKVMLQVHITLYSYTQIITISEYIIGTIRVCEVR